MDWVERVGWVTAALGLPVAIVFGLLAALGGHESCRRRWPQRGCHPWRLLPMAGLRPEHVDIHSASSDQDADSASPAYVSRHHDAALHAQLTAAAVAGGLITTVGSARCELRPGVRPVHA
jgi:hypothetical protein